MMPVRMKKKIQARLRQRMTTIQAKRECPACGRKGALLPEFIDGKRVYVCFRCGHSVTELPKDDTE